MRSVGAAARKLHVCSLMKNPLVKGVQLNVSRVGTAAGAGDGGAASWGAVLGRGGGGLCIGKPPTTPVRVDALNLVVR